MLKTERMAKGALARSLNMYQHILKCSSLPRTLIRAKHDILDENTAVSGEQQKIEGQTHASTDHNHVEIRSGLGGRVPKHSVRRHSSGSDSATMRRSEGCIARFDKSRSRKERGRRRNGSHSKSCRKSPFQRAHADDGRARGDDCMEVGVHGRSPILSICKAS